MPDLFGYSGFQEELEAWQRFIDSLSSDDKEVFDRAVQNAMQYAEFVENAPAGHETEAFLLSVLFAQQKKIEELKGAIGRRNKAEKV
jgi:hypothetical protein